MKTLTFVTGLAIGYVLGTREGREGYDRLKKRATELWGNPRVQRGVRGAQDAVEEAVPAASSHVDDFISAIDDQATAASPAEGLPSNI